MRSRVSLYRLAKNSMSRSFTSFGRSCWIQCPAPGTTTFFVKPGIVSSKLSKACPIHRDHGVELACYEERGLANLGSAEKWRQFPIPVYVPIPVESASEAGSLELFCVEVQICFSQPRRERFRHCAGVEKRLRLVEQKTPALIRRCIARRGVQRHEHRLADVDFELSARPCLVLGNRAGKTASRLPFVSLHQSGECPSTIARR